MQRRIFRQTRLLAALALLAVTTACALFGSSQPTSTVATPLIAPSEPPQASSTATSPSAPTPTLSPTETPAPLVTATQPAPLPTDRAPLSDRLTQSGPWLLLKAPDRLWGANADGSALTQLLDEPVIWMASQPEGNLVAYVTGQRDTMQDLALKILTLPEGSVQTVTWLTNAETQPDPSSGMLDEKIEAVRAILDLKPLAWSPDGRLLAFIGVQDGPSADLYTWEAATGKVNRLTDGPSQGYAPVFSPDGRYIVHFGVTTFGTGAGYAMSGGWAARSDGSGIVTLFSGGGSGQEFAGWLSDNQFLIHSWSPACGPRDLRVQDVRDGRQTTLYSGCFNAAAAVPYTGLALVATNADGLLRINPADGVRETLDPVSPASLDWHSMPPEVLAAGENGIQIYSGIITAVSSAPQLDCDNPLGYAGYGLIYAWTCSKGDTGVWISGPGLETWQAFDGPAAHPTWSPDNTLLFISENRLYHAFFMEYLPAPVAEVPGDVSDVSWAGW